ncbi:MAG: hypothetical protein D6754_13675 [Alphaproteobacteria bacterium]|nr:MAG: hypothetical protein D6754_13675 [Alphaproteobacteria bacterium]
MLTVISNTQTSTGTVVFLGSTAGNALLLTSTGTLASTGQGGLTIFGTGKDQSVAIHGTAVSYGGSPIHMTGDNALVTIGSTGVLQVVTIGGVAPPTISCQGFNATVVNDGSVIGGWAVDIGQGDVMNTGLIQSTLFAAVQIESTGRVFNSGTIQTLSTTSPAIDFSGFDGVAFVENTGSILGAILTDVPGSTADDTVRNAGLITGDVTLGNGNDVYDGRGGRALGTIHGGDGDDVLFGGDSTTIIFGDKGNDVMRGGPLDDTLAGGANADFLRGRDGDDVLDAGAGRDFIRGGRGDDDLFGGPGTDFFEFRRGSDNDVIWDFEDGTDRIDLSWFGFTPANFDAKVMPAISSAGGGASFLDLDQLGGHGSVLIHGLAFGNVDVSDFLLT